MKSFIRNIVLLAVVLVLSYLTAPYFGAWYDKFSPQYGSLFLGTEANGAIFFAGMLVSYVFFVPFVYGLFGIKKNKNWIMILLLPILLLWFFEDRYYIYLPILLALVALGLASLINFIISKSRNSNK